MSGEMKVSVSEAIYNVQTAYRDAPTDLRVLLEVTDDLRKTIQENIMSLDDVKQSIRDCGNALINSLPDIRGGLNIGQKAMIISIIAKLEKIKADG